MGLKSAESARRIHCLIEIAKGLARQLTVVVFEGESVSPSCLLSELHSCMALLRFMLHMPDEARIGIKNRMYCCPICAYVIDNSTTLLDHIVVGHYWGSYSCGKCLAFTTHTTVGMMAHVIGCVQSNPGCSKVRSPRARKLIKFPSPAASPKGRNPRKGTVRKEMSSV